MTQEENLRILATIVATAKTQALYFRNLHEAYQAIYDALVKDRPQLQPILQEEMGKLRDVPPMQSQLDELDLLLQSMAKSQ